MRHYRADQSNQKSVPNRKIAPDLLAAVADYCIICSIALRAVPLFELTPAPDFLDSCPLISSFLDLFQLKPVLGPRQYRLGVDRHHTPGRHEIHEKLPSGLIFGYLLPRRCFGGRAPCPSLRSILSLMFRGFAGARINWPQPPTANAPMLSFPMIRQDYCCPQAKFSVYSTGKK